MMYSVVFSISKQINLQRAYVQISATMDLITILGLYTGGFIVIGWRSNIDLKVFWGRKISNTSWIENLKNRISY